MLLLLRRISFITTKNEILKNNASLSISLYVRKNGSVDEAQAELLLEESLDAWLQSSEEMHVAMNELLYMLETTPPDDDPNSYPSDDEELEPEQTEKINCENAVPPAYLRAVLAAEIVYQNSLRYGAQFLDNGFACRWSLRLGASWAFPSVGNSLRVNEH